MSDALFFKEMVFMDLYDASFVAYTKPVASVNDPFFKKSNVLAPFFGYGKSVHKTKRFIVTKDTA